MSLSVIAASALLSMLAPLVYVIVAIHIDVVTRLRWDKFTERPVDFIRLLVVKPWTSALYNTEWRNLASVTVGATVYVVIIEILAFGLLALL
jgi:hypothetical protein